MAVFDRSFPGMAMDRLMTCPFNSKHQLRESKLSMHIMRKCVDKARAIKERDLVRCPFNGYHYIPRKSVEKHVNYMCRSAREAAQHFGAPKELFGLPVVNTTSDKATTSAAGTDWDASNEPKFTVPGLRANAVQQTFAFFDQDPASLTESDIPYEDLLVLSQMTPAQKRSYRTKRRAFTEAVRQANQEKGNGSGESSSTACQTHQSLASEVSGDSLSKGNQDDRREAGEPATPVTLDREQESAPNDTPWDRTQLVLTPEEIDASWPVVQHVIPAPADPPAVTPVAGSSRSRPPLTQLRISWPENSPLKEPKSCLVPRKRPSPGGDKGKNKKVRFGGRKDR